jgi:hypothetical protein
LWKCFNPWVANNILQWSLPMRVLPKGCERAGKEIPVPSVVFSVLDVASHHRPPPRKGRNQW